MNDGHSLLSAHKESPLAGIWPLRRYGVSSRIYSCGPVNLELRFNQGNKARMYQCMASRLNSQLTVQISREINGLIDQLRICRVNKYFVGLHCIVERQKIEKGRFLPFPV